MAETRPKRVTSDAAETFIFPGVLTVKVFLTGEDTAGTLAVFEDVVEPGVGPGRHIHHHQDEVFFCLDGEFVVEINGELRDLVPGDVAFIPRGTPHAFKNVGESVGRLRYLFSPAFNIDDMFRAFFEASKDGALTDETMASIAEGHGQEFVGPPI